MIFFFSFCSALVLYRYKFVDLLALAFASLWSYEQGGFTRRILFDGAIFCCVGGIGLACVSGRALLGFKGGVISIIFFFRCI